MPVIFSADRICENCNRKFKWHWFQIQRQRMGTAPAFERIPTEKTLVHNCVSRNDTNYDIEVNCPHCGYDNHLPTPWDDLKALCCY